MGVTEEEYVVLLDEAGQPSGQARKADVHSRNTPLHLAFSCWLFDDAGRTLLTRRATTKLTWPGIWTNSFCGHPAPGEAPADAVVRRGAQELGVQVRALRMVLPDFRYTAEMANGIRENEVCPVFVATTSSPVVADAREVDSVRWIDWAELADLVAREPDQFSPWLRLQLTQLAREIGR